MSLNKADDWAGRKKFDIDLEFGQQWEKYIDEMFSGAKTCEVKTERDRWAGTGNICIEVQSYGKPSGLDATEADLWVHNLTKDGKLLCSLVFPTEVLKQLVPKASKGTVMGGDNRASKLHLVPLKKLMQVVTDF
jgi:hypothetical protein